MVTMVIASSLAKEAENASTAGFNGTCSNEGGGKNECSDSTPSTEGMVCTMKPICHRGR